MSKSLPRATAKGRRACLWMGYQLPGHLEKSGWPFVLKHFQQPAMNTLPPIPNEPLRKRWYFADDKNETQGPISLEELQRLAKIGEIRPETHVIEEGETEWRKFAQVPPPIPCELPSDSWYYADEEGKSYGPVSFDELERLVVAGPVNPKTLVKKRGQKRWLPFEVAVLPPIPDASPSLSQSSPPPLPAETPIMEAKGIYGTLLLFPEKVRIKRRGLGSFLVHGLKGDKDIFIAQISSVQFLAAGGTGGGYIQFAFSGGTEAQRGLWQATKDENTVTFKAKESWAFQKIKAEIDQRIAARTTGQSKPKTASYLEELEKLADFRDRGIITKDEFESKKRHLLGI